MHSPCEYSEYPCGHGGGRQPVLSPSFCMRIARTPFKARAAVGRVRSMACIYASVQRVGPECLSGAQFSANAQSHCGPMRA